MLKVRVVVALATVASAMDASRLAADAAQPVTAGRPPPNTTSAEPLEKPEDPPAPVAARDRSRITPVRKRVERDGFVSVQVNVAPGGLNVEGDAANEPSIAVDPTAPLRIAIGWRQFDSVISNFREAGWAFSADGGVTWAFPGVLQEGVFRSDPVLAADADGRFYYYSLISDQTDSILCDMFVSDNRGESWTGPIPAFGGDKAWIAVDTTHGSGRGNVYASWSTAGNEYEDRVFTRSFDGGLTFTFPVPLVPAPMWGTVAVGPEGEVYVVGNEAFDLDRFVLQRSFDAWDPAVPTPTFEWFPFDLGGGQRAGDAIVGADPNPVGLLGQIWVAVDHSDSPSRGTLYVVASVDPDGPDPLDVHVIRSTDGGETWTPPKPIHSDDRNAWQWFGTMSVAPNGRIDVVWVESLSGGQPNLGELYYSASVDGGETWSQAVAITPSFDSWIGWPQQAKLGDYFHMVSDDVGAHLAYAATFNGEQDVYYLRIGDTDCNRNGIGDTEDLERTYLDCDGNGLLDTCEIAANAALDSDGDRVIDACRVPPRRGGRRLAPDGS